MAQTAKDLVIQLRTRGELFRFTATSLDGRHLEIAGLAAGIAVLRIRDVSGDHGEAVRLQDLHASEAGQAKALRALLDAAPYPAWLRDDGGKLTWVNAAYARAVEAKDQEFAVVAGVELLEHPAREASSRGAQADAVWRGRAPAVVAGERRMFEIVDAPAATPVRRNGRRCVGNRILERCLDPRDAGACAHARSAFDGGRHFRPRESSLVFHNAAYRQLWALDQAWLDQKPTDSEILDRLRGGAAVARAGRFPRLEGKLSSPPISRSRPANRSGICRTGARCAWSSIPIRKAASPISSTT